MQSSQTSAQPCDCTSQGLPIVLIFLYSISVVIVKSWTLKVLPNICMAGLRKTKKYLFEISSAFDKISENRSSIILS